MVEVSIITCVYNTKKEYLEKCLDSVFKNTLKNFELILVDDGSTTNYDDLVSSYKVKYFKTKNQGLLNARMFGFGKATGKYVYFIDSDDLISFNYLEPMLKRAKKEKADIVFNDWANYAGSNLFCIKDDPILKHNFCFKNKEVLPFYFSRCGKFHSFYVVWNKLYKYSVLKKSFEKIKELNLDNLVFCEDVLLNFFAHMFAKKICNVHCGLYFYRIHEGQETNTRTRLQLERQITSASFVFKTIEKEISKNKLYKYINKNFLNWKIFLSYNQYLIAKANKFYDLSKMIEEDYDIKIKKPGLKLLLFFQKQLPVNTFELFETLEKACYQSNNNAPICIYCKKKSFFYYETKQTLENYKKLNFSIEKRAKKADFVLKEKYNFIRRILNLTPISFTAQLIFPKGSKGRIFLKRKLMGRKK